jgi:hypothetical protein
MNDNFCLVLCYANWCAHCTSYYIKNEDRKEIDIKDISKVKEEKKIPDDVKTWQEVREYVEKKLNCKVTQFEDEADFEQNENSEFDLINMKPKGWPTIMMCKRKNEKEKYERFSIFEGNRTSLADIKKFVEDCISGNVQKSEQTGGSIDYRMKYKKYKQMYSELVHKYNTLKHKTN